MGLPEPDKSTSPIVEAGENIGEVLPNEHLHRCLFNGAPHAIGDIVQSGSTLLRCQAPGVWVREPPQPV